MSELETITITNTLPDAFTVRFNGEPYSLAAGEKKNYPQFLAFHIAKHLTDQVLSKEVEKIRKAKSENPYRPEVGQLLVYDNPKRRIALYDVLGTKELVESCLNAHNFKGFIGNMEEYDEYVSKAMSKTKEKSAAPESE